MENIVKLRGKDAKVFEKYISKKLSPKEKKSLEEADQFYSHCCSE